MSHIELKIIADGPADLGAALNGLLANLLAGTALPQAKVVEQPAAEEAKVVEQPAAEEAKPEPARRTRKTPEAKADEPVVAATQDVEPAPTVQAPLHAPAVEATVVAYSDVQAAVSKLAAAKGRTAVMGVFEQFGVDHGNKLTEAQWPEAIAALGDALAAEEMA